MAYDAPMVNYLSRWADFGPVQFRQGPLGTMIPVIFSSEAGHEVKFRNHTVGVFGSVQEARAIADKASVEAGYRLVESHADLPCQPLEAGAWNWIRGRLIRQWVPGIPAAIVVPVLGRAERPRKRLLDPDNASLSADDSALAISMVDAVLVEEGWKLEPTPAIVVEGQSVGMALFCSLVDLGVLVEPGSAAWAAARYQYGIETKRRSWPGLTKWGIDHGDCLAFDWVVSHAEE